MDDRIGCRLAAIGFVLFVAGGVLPARVAAQAPPAPRPPAPAPAPGSLQGLWRSADTTIRIVMNNREVRGMFAEVGEGARALGFKPGELSFVATVNGNYLYGQRTIRYRGNCHPNGRKVPMMGRMTPDGRVLAVHYYNVVVDPNCRDTGEYRVAETLWQRVAAR